MPLCQVQFYDSMLFMTRVPTNHHIDKFEGVTSCAIRKHKVHVFCHSQAQASLVEHLVASGMRWLRSPHLCPWDPGRRTRPGTASWDQQRTDVRCLDQWRSYVRVILVPVQSALLSQALSQVLLHRLLTHEGGVTGTSRVTVPMQGSMHS